MSNQLGDFLKTRRKFLSMSLDKMAEATGLAKSTLSEIENGKYEPSFTTACAISLGYRASLKAMAAIVDARIADGFEITALREQLARMPVRIGYVSRVDVEFFDSERDFDLPITRDETVVFDTAIYIDPPAQEPPNA